MLLKKSPCTLDTLTLEYNRFFPEVLMDRTLPSSLQQCNELGDTWCHKKRKKDEIELTRLSSLGPEKKD
jgi:hypothetical protein